MNEPQANSPARSTRENVLTKGITMTTEQRVELTFSALRQANKGDTK